MKIHRNELVTSIGMNHHRLELCESDRNEGRPRYILGAFCVTCNILRRFVNSSTVWVVLYKMKIHRNEHVTSIGTKVVHMMF